MQRLVNCDASILLHRRQIDLGYFRRLSSIRFTKDHEWVKLDESDRTAAIGITDYAQKALGDVVYVELPKTGETITQHEVLGIVESVKGASDIYSPVEGRIVEVNNEVLAKPSLINSSPMQKGWLCKIKPFSPQSIESLMSEAQYSDFCKSG